MTNFYKTLILFFLSVSALTGIAQSIKSSVISSSGGTISDSTIILNWTLGETIIQNIQSGNNSLSQGFHQPFYNIIPTVENKTSLFDVKIFPNPSSDILHINIISDHETQVEIYLTDINGKILFQKKLTTIVKQHNLTYDTKNLATATYFLRLTDISKNILETFKIQKVHYCNY